MTLSDRCDRIGMWGMYAIGGFVGWLTGNPLMTCVVGGICAGWHYTRLRQERAL